MSINLYMGLSEQGSGRITAGFHFVIRDEARVNAPWLVKDESHGWMWDLELNRHNYLTMVQYAQALGFTHGYRVGASSFDRLVPVSRQMVAKVAKFPGFLDRQVHDTLGGRGRWRVAPQDAVQVTVPRYPGVHWLTRIDPYDPTHTYYVQAGPGWVDGGLGYVTDVEPIPVVKTHRPVVRNWSGRLRLLEIEEDWSVYVDEHGDAVHLRHGDGRRLVPFEDLDWVEEHTRWLAERSPDDEFLDHLERLTTDPDEVRDSLFMCPRCTKPEWEDDGTWVNGEAEKVCDSCVEAHFHKCGNCETYHSYVYSTMGNEEICDYCRSECYSYCDYCDDYYHSETGHDCPGDEDECDCESPQQEFTVRNDGQDPLNEDESTKVSLPAGVISGEGLQGIRNLIQQRYYEARNEDMDPDERTKWWQLACDFEAALGDEWQTRQGNFTKRLSRHAYKTHGLKVPPEMISAVGNIASEHSRAVDFNVEVTRDLNQSAADFYHEDSCWWQSYYHGRCALKTNGGFGLRTFSDRSDMYGAQVRGRAWVMPLKQNENGSLSPTFDTVNPAAFVVFNGYGDLQGYTGARIVAHMAGWTYRKVEFHCDPMYVNSGVGYLVAPEELAQQYTDGAVRLSVSQHSDLFMREQAAAESKELVDA